MKVDIIDLTQENDKDSGPEDVDIKVSRIILSCSLYHWIIMSSPISYLDVTIS